MSTALVLLFLVSILSLLVGLISPALTKKLIKLDLSRRKILTIFGGLTVLFFVLIGVTSPTPQPKVATDKQVEGVSTKNVIPLPSASFASSSAILQSSPSPSPTQKPSPKVIYSPTPKPSIIVSPALQQVPQIQSSQSAPCGTYINTYGNEVPSPCHYDSAPAGATAKCVDGTYSYSQSRRGTCSHHGGVAQWL